MKISLLLFFLAVSNNSGSKLLANIYKIKEYITNYISSNSKYANRNEICSYLALMRYLFKSIELFYNSNKKSTVEFCTNFPAIDVMSWLENYYSESKNLNTKFALYSRNKANNELLQRYTHFTGPFLRFIVLNRFIPKLEGDPVGHRIILDHFKIIVKNDYFEFAREIDLVEYLLFKEIVVETAKGIAHSTLENNDLYFFSKIGDLYVGFVDYFKEHINPDYSTFLRGFISLL